MNTPHKRKLNMLLRNEQSKLHNLFVRLISNIKSKEDKTYFLSEYKEIKQRLKQLTNIKNGK